MPDIQLNATWGTIGHALALAAGPRSPVPTGCSHWSSFLIRAEVPTPRIPVPPSFPKAVLLLPVGHGTSPVAHVPYCESPFVALGVLSCHRTFFSATLGYLTVAFTFRLCRDMVGILGPFPPGRPLNSPDTWLSLHGVCRPGEGQPF